MQSSFLSRHVMIHTSYSSLLVLPLLLLVHHHHFPVLTPMYSVCQHGFSHSAKATGTVQTKYRGPGTKGNWRSGKSLTLSSAPRWAGGVLWRFSLLAQKKKQWLLSHVGISRHFINHPLYSHIIFLRVHATFLWLLPTCKMYFESVQDFVFHTSLRVSP